jgi:hypothetical protein
VRKFLLSLAAFALLVFGIDRALGRALRWMYESPGGAEVDDLGTGARRHPQIAISGSSRARNHYVADSLEQYLGKRVHTFGRGGQFSSLYQYSVAQLVLTESTPDVWVIEADARLYRGSDSDKLAELLPYATRNAAIREAVTTRSRFERVKFWSRAYPYNSLALNLVKERLRPTWAVPRNGFHALRGRINPRERVDSLETAEFFPPVDSVKLEYLHGLVDSLRSRGVRVLAVRSPFYAGDTKTRALLQREGRELAAVFASMAVPFIDVSGERYPEFASSEVYANRRHLNEQGALRFSRIIADSITQLLARPAPARPLGAPCIVVAGSPRAAPGISSAGVMAQASSVVPAGHGC